MNLPQLPTRNSLQLKLILRPTPEEGSAPPMPPGGLPPSGQYIADSHDGTILWAHVIRFKHLSGSGGDGGETDNDKLDALRNAAKRLAAPEIRKRGVADYCGPIRAPRFINVNAEEWPRPGTFGVCRRRKAVQCTCVLGSSCATYSSAVPPKVRQCLIFEALTSRCLLKASNPPFAIVVKHLQECLTRMETFEVVTVSPSGDGMFCNDQIPSYLTKPLTRFATKFSLLARAATRLRLVREGNDIPRSCTNITVSIHASATFQALHDYLRPRVSSQGLPPNSRIVSKLAAFAAAVGLPPPGVLQRTSIPTTGQPTGGSTVKDAPRNTPLGATAVDPSREARQKAAEPSTFESDKGPRGSRSAKSGARSAPSLPQPSALSRGDPYLWLVVTDLTFSM
jgi:E3 ubiquitin-protein ligase TRIP12